MAKMYDIDTEDVIKAVRARPPLYNRLDRFFGQKKVKDRLWKEVCMEVNSKWRQMNRLDAHCYAREIKKRWKSLRTSYTRELTLQRREKQERESGIPVKRRKRYEYFDMLSFIAEETDGFEGVEKHDSRFKLEQNFDDEESVAQDDSYSEKEVLYDFDDSSRDDDRKKASDLKFDHDISQYQHGESIFDRGSGIEERILDMLNDIKKNEDDDDRQFILSLIPSFKAISPRKKMEAKIEILKVIQTFHEFAV